MPDNVAVFPPIDVEISVVSSIAKGGIINTAVTANTNIFGSALSPTNTPSIFRIYAVFDTIGRLFVRRTNGATTVSEDLNQGTLLVANAGYMFDVLTRSGDTFNLQYSINATAISLVVVEVQSAA